MYLLWFLQNLVVLIYLHVVGKILPNCSTIIVRCFVLVKVLNEIFPYYCFLVIFENVTFWGKNYDVEYFVMWPRCSGRPVDAILLQWTAVACRTLSRVSCIDWQPTGGPLHSHSCVNIVVTTRLWRLGWVQTSDLFTLRVMHAGKVFHTGECVSVWMRRCIQCERTFILQSWTARQITLNHHVLLAVSEVACCLCNNMCMPVHSKLVSSLSVKLSVWEFDMRSYWCTFCAQNVHQWGQLLLSLIDGHTSSLTIIEHISFVKMKCVLSYIDMCTTDVCISMCHRRYTDWSQWWVRRQLMMTHHDCWLAAQSVDTCVCVCALYAFHILSTQTPKFNEFCIHLCVCNRQLSEMHLCNKMVPVLIFHCAKLGWTP